VWLWVLRLWRPVRGIWDDLQMLTQPIGFHEL
jgi:hypothetical protein